MRITQRTATLDDADTLLTWRNHPSTRKFSQQPKEILSDEHMYWLTARLKKVHLEPFYLFIGDCGAIGMSRLDFEATHKYEISILVDPNQQGRGVGTKILTWTGESFYDQYPNFAIIAYVHRSNFVSQKLFLRAGFELLPSLGDFVHFEKSLN